MKTDFDNEIEVPRWFRWDDWLKGLVVAALAIMVGAVVILLALEFA